MTIFDAQLKIPLQKQMKYYRNDIGSIEVENIKMVGKKPQMKLRINNKKAITVKNFKKEKAHWLWNGLK